MLNWQFGQMPDITRVLMNRRFFRRSRRLEHQRRRSQIRKKDFQLTPGQAEFILVLRFGEAFAADADPAFGRSARRLDQADRSRHD
jgi:hypothetical protein